MANITGVPNGAEVVEITTVCESCGNQVIVFPGPQMIQQVVGGKVCYDGITRTNEVVLTFDCLFCGFQNDVIA